MATRERHIYNYLTPEPSTPQEREDECCEPIDSPPFPECWKDGEKRTTWNGSEEQDHWPDSTKRLIEQAGLPHLGTAADPKIRVSYIPRKNPCGETVEKYLEHEECCGEGSGDDFEWDQYYTQLEVDQSYVFRITGGVSPYVWSVLGSGLQITQGGSAAVLSVTDCFCHGTVIVEDSCGNILTHGINNQYGSWVLLSETEYLITGKTDQYHPLADYHAFYFHGVIRYEDNEYKIEQPLSRQASGFHSLEETEDWYCNHSTAPVAPAPYPIALNLQYPDFKMCPERIWNYYNWDNTIPGAYPGVNVFATQPPKTWQWQCPEAPELLMSPSSGVVIADSSVAYIAVTGGKAPFTIRCNVGDNIFLDSARTITEKTQTNSWFTLYSANVCGEVSLNITDSCGDTVYHTLQATNGYWDGLCMTWYIWGTTRYDEGPACGYWDQIFYDSETYGSCWHSYPLRYDQSGRYIPRMLGYIGLWRWYNNSWYQTEYIGSNSYVCYDAYWELRNIVLSKGIPYGVLPNDFAPNGPNDIKNTLKFCSSEVNPCQWVC